MVELLVSRYLFYEIPMGAHTVYIGKPENFSVVKQGAGKTNIERLTSNIEWDKS